MLQPWQIATVIKIEQHTHNTKNFFLQLNETESFSFLPGQFITFDLPIHEKPAKRLRSYSIASAPDVSNIIELCIVFLEGGLGTTYLFNEVNVGSQLTLRGPVGVFTLPKAEELEQPLFLICTGTGIAPFRSMMHYLHNQQISFNEVHLIFGCRTNADLLYFDEMQTLQNAMPNFTYVPTLSREQWEGKTGYVHEHYLPLLAQKPHAHFMLCGWKAMVDEAKQHILAAGFDKKAVHVELYG
jgi:glycine betaine catabolism B